MAESIVSELQSLAADSSQDMSDLLRKALIVATKLRQEECRKWILWELNGYKEIEDLPDYRKIKGDLRAHNPMVGLIPVIIKDEDFALIISRRNVFESVSSLGQCLKSPGEVTYRFPPNIEQSLMAMQDSYDPLRPMLVVGRNQIAAIIGCVRTRILDWALALESRGILGDGITFSDREKRLAMNQNIRIDNFQGVLGDVSQGGRVEQTNLIGVHKSDFASLSEFLKKQGVDEPDITELKQALSADPIPATTSSFGPKVNKWIGKMIEKAASGVWKVSISVAGNILSSAISKHYGL